MSLSVEKHSAADSEFANKLLFIVDSILDIYFGQKKALYQLIVGLLSPLKNMMVLRLSQKFCKLIKLLN